MSENSDKKKIFKDIKVDSRIAIGIVIVVVCGMFLLISKINSKPIERRVPEQKLINKSFTTETDQHLSDKIALERQIEAVGTYSKEQIDKIVQDNKNLKQAIEELTKLVILQSKGNQTENGQSSGNYPPSPPNEYGSHDNQPPISLPPLKKEVIGGVRRISWQSTAETATDNKSAVKYNFFPTTTLMKGTLLNGMYAPTLTKGRSAPLPAVVRIDDLAILPNEIRKNIEGCRLLGEAYGELSDSRVHIRLTKLACVGFDGKAYVDSNVKGVIFGEDGTIGMHGETVANFNKILLNSFFMESLASLGEAIKVASTTTVISDSGVSKEYVDGDRWEKAGNTLLAGGGAGLGSGFKLISDFYISMLKEMSPVIKINGGRNVEILFTEGISLELQENIWTYGDLL